MALSFKQHETLVREFIQPATASAPSGQRLLEQAFEEKQIKPTDISIPRLFEACFGSDKWHRGRHDRNVLVTQIMEHAGAVTTAAFQGISGQIVYNAIKESYQGEEFIFSKKVKDIQTEFNGEKIAGVSDIGDEALTVGEAMPYPLAGVSEDYIETPTTQKKGLIVPLTREAIFFDRTGRLLEQCSKVGYWLGANKEKRIIDAFVDQNETRHRYKWRGTSYATYQASTPWINLKTSAALVDWTDINDAEQLMWNYTDPNTGEPIVIMPKELVVCPELLHTARQIVTATNIRLHAGGYATTGNLSDRDSPSTVTPYEIVTSRWLKARQDAASAPTTRWYLSDIARTVQYMQNWPLETTQSPPNSHLEFTQDIVTQYKASERGAAVVVEPRASVQNSA